MGTLSLDDRWSGWIRSNLERGCTFESLVRTMVKSGFEKTISEFHVNRIASELTGTDGNAAAILFLPDANAFETGDRRVSVRYTMENPNIVVLDDVLSKDECEELVERSRSKLKASRVVDHDSGSFELHAHRTSSGTHFALGEVGVVATLEARLAAIVGWPADRAEGLQILNYQVGAEYKPHFDFFDPAKPGSARQLKGRGQRVATIIMYLNDVARGGETIFPGAGVKVAPRKGAAVYFSNCFPDGRTNPLTLHGGAPVLEGEKWIATKWLRQAKG